MRIYLNNDGWDSVYDDANFTVAMLGASVVHAALGAPLDAHTALWAQIDDERRRAAVGVVQANARMAWCNVTLDRATVRFATQLLADCDGQRKHALYTAFFEVAPNEITRLALESQLDAMWKFPTIAGAVQLKAATRELFDAVLDAMAKGREAVKARDAAELAVTSVSRRQAAWRDEANRLRRAIETALDAYANQNGLARDYAGNFFPMAKTAKKPSKKATATPAASAPTAAAVTAVATAPALSANDQVLALPDPILKALAEDFVAALPANVQAIVRARRTG